MAGDTEGTEGGASSLEEAILGGALKWRSTEVAAEVGIPVDDARRLWRALGFADSAGERAYADLDISAISTLIQAVDSGFFDFDMALTLTRAVGQTMARLADWEVAALLHRVVGHDYDEPQAGESPDAGRLPATPASRSDTARRMIEEFADGFEELLIYAWRRHLAATVARLDGVDDDDQTVALSVGFADIVSFTALSNELTRHEVGDLVEVFEARCADVVTGNGGRLIKSIGDSVLFVNDDPIGAYDTAEGIINVVGKDPRMPAVRVGLASGSVVTRQGDVFGPPVNMAARLTAVARRNRIIIDEATAALLPGDQFETRRLPARSLRGFGLVEPLAVRRH